MSVLANSVFIPDLCLGQKNLSSPCHTGGHVTHRADDHVHTFYTVRFKQLFDVRQMSDSFKKAISQ